MTKTASITSNPSRSLLQSSLGASPSERIRIFQKFLKIENLRLLSLHRSGAGGDEVASKRSLMMDELLQHLFLASLQSATGVKIPGEGQASLPPLCLVSTGGYGRGQLNPLSDVDILFILEEAKGPQLVQINAAVEGILYLLWDLGLKVGHATRTIRECVNQGRRDMQSLTALMESRPIAGTRRIFDLFQKSIQEGCLGSPDSVRNYLEERVKNQVERHAKFGGTVFVQEPNIKNGCGGLRDFQNLLWVSRAQAGAPTLEALCQKGIISPIEEGKLARAHDFLMRVRNELHYSHDRPMDEITLSEQPKIAGALGYHAKSVLLLIETFMRDYYRHARDIFLLGEALMERLTVEGLGRKSNRWLRWLPFRAREDTVEILEGGLQIRNKLLGLTPDSPFPSHPHDLLQVFRTAQLRRVRLGFDLQSRIRQRLELVNHEFLYARRPREIFLAILSAKGEVGRVLRMMHECGLLGRYIPEFGKLDCLVQHEFYHRYTADEHTLLALEKLDEILNAIHGASARYGRIFQQMEKVHLLYLAILLHDTGKVARARHHNDVSAENARRVARRLCLDPLSRQTLVWVVDHHMTMSQLAQRRDLEDPATIQDFRNTVATRENLDMLHLITFVDGQAVGSTTWSEWRQILLWQLYENTVAALSRSGEEMVRTEARREELKAAIAGRLPSTIMEDEVEAHFIHMPPRYWRRVEVDELAWHFEILHDFFENLLESESSGTSPVIAWRHYPDRGYSEAVVCTWDRHGLFAKIAGSFSAARINILNADIYTRSDNLVLDIFQVCDLEHRALEENDPRTKHMESLLVASLAGTQEVSFSDAIAMGYESMRHMPLQGEERFPTSIIFDQEDSRDYTILEIQTPDRLGLLFHILETLTHCGLDIDLAKINTEKGAAMDVFYLTDTEGRKISDPARLATIQGEMGKAIDKLNRPFRAV